MSVLSPNQLKDPAITKLIRVLKPNEVLFKQGKPGKTMYIVVEGYVRVLFHRSESDHLVGILGPGEVIGEKAILIKDKPYNRTFTVQAKTPTTLLEIETKTLELLLNNWPDFHMRMLRMIGERLDKANELISLLQSPDPFERFSGYILYFYKHHCKKLPVGMFVTMTVDEIRYAVNLEREFVEKCLTEATNHNIFTAVLDGYILTNEQSFLKYIHKMKENAAA